MNNLDTCISNSDTDNTNDSLIEYDFDTYYLDCFIATGNKTESYRKASAAVGHTYVEKYVSQYAKSIHSRLNKEGLIDQALRLRATDDRVDSRNVLNELRDDKESGANVRFQVAKLQAGALYDSESQQQGIEVTVNRDNVQIKSGKDTLTIENDK